MKRKFFLGLFFLAGLLASKPTEAIYCDEAVMRWFPQYGWVCLFTAEGGEVCTLCSDEIDVPDRP